VPGHVAKYDDSFNPRAFGDLVQRWGTSTVLIESGGWRDDPEKQYLRQVNVAGITAALDAIASGSYATADISRYESLLENGPAAYDILVRGGRIVLPGFGVYRADIAINRAEFRGRNQGGNIAEVGDLAEAHARDTVHAEGLFVHPDAWMRSTMRDERPRITVGQPVSFRITSDSAGLEPLYSIEAAEVRRISPAEARPAGLPHAAVGCHALEIGAWSIPNRNMDFQKPPATIELMWTMGTARQERGMMLLRPARGALQGHYRGMTWTAPDAQTIQLTFTTGLSGQKMILRRDGEVYRGTATQLTDVMFEGKIDPTAPVVLRRLPCQ
jgi:hypothetical protein